MTSLDYALNCHGGRTEFAAWLPPQVVVFGGGSFGTAMAAALANQKESMEVVLLLRDPGLCDDINTSHCNSRYLPVRAQYESSRKQCVYSMYGTVWHSRKCRFQVMRF
jgi:hypothetical protein